MQFKDPAIWSAVIAVLALVLSQLPPVRELVKRRKVRIVTPDVLNIYHYFGRINLNLPVGLHNVGGRAVVIAKIECVITRGESKQWVLPAQTYYSRQAPSQAGQAFQEYAMDWIALKPGEHYSETVHCYQPWSEEEERRVAEITAEVRSNINQKRRQMKLSELTLLAVEADESAVKKARDFFEQNFGLTIGQYQLFIRAESEKEQTLSLQGFRFVMYDAWISALRAVADGYKTGAGIWFAPDPDHARPVWVRLDRMSAADTMNAWGRLTARNTR